MNLVRDLARPAATALLRAATTVLTMAALWELVVRVGGVPPYYLPSLADVARAVAVAPSAYANGALRTVAETVLGFAAGSLFGVAIGLAFFQWRRLKDYLFPLFVVSQTIPVIAFGAVVVLWFGNTLWAKAVIAFYMSFFPVAVNTLQGLEAVDPRQVALLRSFGATPWQVVSRLRLPAALPQIFVALKLGCTLSLLGAIAGEWFGDSVGVGVLLLQAMYNEQVPSLWAAIFLAGAIGTTLYALVNWAESRLVFWRRDL
jgi:NitT/TauT family transport system permease protein